MVGVQGFEPRQAESESAVLPLDDTPLSLSATPYLGSTPVKGLRRDG